MTQFIVKLHKIFFCIQESFLWPINCSQVSLKDSECRCFNRGDLQILSPGSLLVFLFFQQCLSWSVSVLVTAITNYRKTDDLKRQKCILSQFWRQEIHSFSWDTISGRPHSLFYRFRDEKFQLPALGGGWHSCITAPLHLHLHLLLFLCLISPYLLFMRMGFTDCMDNPG